MAVNENDSFRDAISTVEQSGERVWLYPKKPRGPYYSWRKIVAAVLVVLLFAAPIIHINGRQFILINVVERKFHIFGQPFWPQDFHLLVLLMIIGVIFVSLFTVAYGRLFCGWVCPQTVFLEMIFRPLEYWIEGDRNAQKRLNKQPWNKDKILKKSVKWILYFLISLLISAVFMCYVMGSKEVFLHLKTPLEYPQTTLFLLIFSSVFYFVFAWFREQVCIIACPYGRLQGVLLDSDSVVVAYDHVRGEKEIGRSKINRKEDRATSGKGDCIDCKLCVDVCPTGIDIRHGTQLECVNCTACIDACNEVMEKVHFPKNLIRYASMRQIKQGNRFRWTARLKAYTILLSMLLGLFVFLVMSRNDLETGLFRIPGQLYALNDETNSIQNVFTFKIVNKTTHPIDSLHFVLLNQPKGTIYTVNKKATLHLKAEEILDGTVFIELPKDAWLGKPQKLRVGVYHKEDMLDKTTVRFTGPRTYQ